MAFYFVENPENKLYVDHIDNNKLNNLFSNLRWATVQENRRNIVMYKNNTTGVKGIIYDKRYNKWMARIRVSKKLIHICSLLITESAVKNTAPLKLNSLSDL